MENGKLISEDRGRVVWFVSSFSSLPAVVLVDIPYKWWDVQEAQVPTPWEGHFFD